MSRFADSSIVSTDASQRVVVRVPGTSSNLGPGFDTLGLALSLYNFVSLEVADAEAVSATNENIPAETVAMAEEARAAFAEAASVEAMPFRFDIWGEIPSTRGLGSSASLRCAFIAGLNALYDSPLSSSALIDLGTQLDAAADGITAAFLGGFTVARLDPKSNRYVGVQRFPLSSDVAFVTAVPETRVSSPLQRKALPEKLPFDDAVKTVNSLANVVAAFASGDLSRLAGNITDYLHQPYRERLCPYTQEAIAAGNDQGAWAGWLSGSGSTVICVGPIEAEREIGEAMRNVFEGNGVATKILHLRADNDGLVVE